MINVVLIKYISNDIIKINDSNVNFKVFIFVLYFRSRRVALKRTGSIDCFGVPVSRNPFRNRSQTISTAKYKISSYRRSSSTQSDPGRRLSKTFSIQILENDNKEDDRKSSI